MKRILIALMLALPLCAQWVDFSAYTASTNLSNAMNAKLAYAFGTVNPVTCTASKEVFWNTNTGKLYFCTSTNTWTEVPLGPVTGAVTSVFGRAGAVTATPGDYTTAQITESGSLYFTNARARLSLSGTAPISYDNLTGTFSCSACITTSTSPSAGDVSGQFPNLVVTGIGGKAANASNLPNTVVIRDSSGNFSAATITASLSGNASTATAFASTPTGCTVNGQFMTGMTANGTAQCSTPTGSGDVSGPANAVSGHIVTFSGSSGKIVQDSGVAMPSSAPLGLTDVQSPQNKTMDNTNSIAGDAIKSGIVAAARIADLSATYMTKAGTNTVTAYNDISGGRFRPPEATFASAPGTLLTGQVFLFTDASALGTCSGGGTAKALCRYTGSAWEAISGGGSSGATLLQTGTSVSLTAPRQYYVCTGTCTVTPPVPSAGYEFCVLNGNNISTVITMAALGSSAMYQKTDNTAYGTAGTGTMISSGAVGDKVCIVGLDSTHYLTTGSVGTWTVN